MERGVEQDQQSGDRPVAGIAAYAVSFAVASLGDAIAKLVTAVLPVAQVIALRGLFLLILFIPFFIAAAQRGQPIMATAHPWLHIARVSLHTLSTVAVFFALPHLPLTTFTTISFIAPIFIALAAVPILGERITPPQLVAIVTGFIGCAIILRPRGDGEIAFMLLAIVSSAAWATSIPILRMLARTESYTTILAWQNAPVAAIASAIALLEWRPLDYRLALLIAAMAALQIVGHFFSTKALRLAPAATLAPVQYTQILWATLIGMMIFNEWPQPTVWLGAAFIVAGGFWLMRSAR